MSDDNDGQMIFGELGGLKLPDICLNSEENPEKTSPRKPVPTGDPTRARSVTGGLATVLPTAVDSLNSYNRLLNTLTHIALDYECTNPVTYRSYGKTLTSDSYSPKFESSTLFPLIYFI